MENSWIKKNSWIAAGTAAAFLMLAPIAALCGTGATNYGALTPQALEKIVPGKTTKADIQSLLGRPWRVVQFNDCGEAMADQADETWEYRGADASGGFRLHVEFDDSGVVHLIAKIPDATQGGKGTVAKVAPGANPMGMSM
jgi:hypothetical protein